MAITSPIELPIHHPFAGRDVWSVLADRAAAHGDRPFLIWEPSAEGAAPATWTYRSFAEAVERTAAGMADRGVGSGDAVMIFLDNCPAFLISWFACARLGAVAVDTNARYVADEVAYAAALTEPVGVITHAKLADRVSSVGDAWVVHVDETTGTCPDLDGDPTALPSRPADPGAPMCIQFTSGTTSRPKAALYTHANALWAGSVSAAHGRFRSDDVSLVHAPLFHTMALFWQTLPSMWVGAAVVVVPKYSRSRFWDISLRHRCTRTFLLALMLDLGNDPIPDHHYKSWIGGAEMPAVEAAFGVRILTSWGMTEVVTNVLVGDLDTPGTPGVIGRVSPEYGVRIVDDEGLDAEEGELRVSGVRGLSLFAGYHANPESTAEGFDELGHWRTGDRVRLLPSGEIQFVSRIKAMLRVGGENVAAAEIERVLLEHPKVTGAGVVGHPDKMRGEVAFGFVVASGESEASIGDELIAHCAERLADFKVPRRVCVIDELPESLIGKTSTKTLQAMAVELGLEAG